MQIKRCAVWLGIFLLLIPLSGESQENRRMDLPEGFQGIYLGMSYQELLEIRPSVGLDPMDQKVENEKVDVTKPNQTLEELIENDSRYHLDILGTYTFRERSLKEVKVFFVGDIKMIRKFGPMFIKEGLEKWGPPYKKMVTKQEDTFCPQFVWETGDIIRSISCTVKPIEKSWIKKEEGCIRISLSFLSDDFSTKVLKEEVVDKQTKESLFDALGIN